MGFEDFNPPVKLKLAVFWAALMFCYVYADFFGLFVPGRLADMNNGIMSPIGNATPAVLLATSVMMIIPSLMVIAALLLRPGINRWLNIAFGILYAGIILLTMAGAPPFYLLFGTVEVALSLSIAAYAWRWPRATVESER